MPLRLTDAEIVALLSERKFWTAGALSSLTFASKMGHREYNTKIKGANGSNFTVILRHSFTNALDFSVVLGYEQPGWVNLFRLRRYNGNSHQHTNPIEKQTFLDFHMHTATERYQLRPGSREDSFAEPTTHYADFNTAVQCLFADCGFSSGILIAALPPKKTP